MQPAANASLYDFKDYREYLRARLTLDPESRGRIALLARQLSCQSSFLSQVISRRAHLSREHAHSTVRHLGFTPDEQRFFMLLVEENRASTPQLKTFYHEQLDEILERRQLVREQIKVRQKIADPDKLTYYTAWWYAAIHIITALPGHQTVEEIARRLNLSIALVQSTLDFLKEAKLVVEKRGRYFIGAERIHVDKSSPVLAKHHANWRFKAIQAIENSAPEDLSYSAVIGISQKDAAKLRAMLLEMIRSSESVLQESSVEDAYVFTLDFFRLR